MKGIARLASELGISTGTVSRALNGKPDVNADTRARVLEAAQRIGYAPNASARNLAKGVTNSVGFMIELNPLIASNNDNFFMGVFDGVQSVLRRQGLDLLVLPCPTGDDPYVYLQRFVARDTVDAMILSATQTIDPRIDLLQSRNIPFVALGRSDSGSGYSWIDLDVEGVVHQSVDRLVAHGHRRIAATVPSGGINFNTLFRTAYREALDRHGLPYDPALAIDTQWGEPGGYEMADKAMALAEPPTAVLLIYEMMALGFYRRLNELGKVPGKDVAVITFRDEPVLRFLQPSVTCFSMSLHDLGVAVAENVLVQLSGTSAPPVQMRWPMLLRPGESDQLILDPPGGPSPHP
jgi:DNA-binding LacI/PurR family transcriptional regulator